MTRPDAIRALQAALDALTPATAATAFVPLLDALRDCLTGPPDADEPPNDLYEPPYQCSRCDGIDVQVSYPTWCTTDDLTPVEVDVEAIPLDTWCVTCEAHTDLHPTTPGLPVLRGSEGGAERRVPCEGCHERVATSGPVPALCDACKAELDADLAQQEQPPDHPGSRCTDACGHCGRCGGA